LAEAGIPVSNLADRAQVLRTLNGGRSLPPARVRRYDDGFSRLKLDRRLDAEAAAAAPVPDDPDEADLVSRYIAYERWLSDNNALDFDDLVRRAVAVLQSDDGLRRSWQKRCSSLLVDEVQDVDRCQLDMALLLTGERRDIFLVGDDDQTIYAWRLADVRRVLDLAGALPGLRRVDLVTNYRCPRPVVERAVRLIEMNMERFAKQIRAGPSAEGALLLCPDTGDELDRARRLIREWLPAAPGVHAVLARTNAELAPFAAVALENGIPYRAAEDGLLLDDPGLDHLLDGLRGESPPAVALARLADRSVTARALIGWALTASSADELRGTIKRARDARNALRRDDAQLILATAHGTKGLEFDHVAVVGMDENVFPSRRTIEEADDPVRATEEERRLAYVAWTRARKSLLLVYDPAAPSRFMRDAFSDDELGLLRSV
jgi:superfamily I DNA/RNA helicase